VCVLNGLIFGRGLFSVLIRLKHRKFWQVMASGLPYTASEDAGCLIVRLFLFGAEGNGLLRLAALI
jgi:hypothetical protein